MHVGLFPGSFKPPHRGHWATIRRAATECEQVIIFASTSDRCRKGETPILGRTVTRLWQMLELSLPENVELRLSATPPVRLVYETLGHADVAASDDVYTIYGVEVDLAKNYPYLSLVNYCGGLYTRGCVQLAAVPRIASSTHVRQLLREDRCEEFLAEMPPVTEREKLAMWEALRSDCRVQLLPSAG